MKKVAFLLPIMLLFSLSAFSQTVSLRDSVISRMAQDLNYIYQADEPSAPAAAPRAYIDSSGARPVVRESFPMLPDRPLVLLDGKFTVVDSLTQWPIEQVRSIEVLEGRKASALYGSRARKGVILINTAKQ